MITRPSHVSADDIYYGRNMLTRCCQVPVMPAIREMDLIAIRGPSTMPNSVPLNVSSTDRSILRSPPSTSRFPAVGTAGVGQQEFVASRSILVTRPSPDTLVYAIHPVSPTAVPARISLVFYAGLEGLGGLEMDTEENENVSCNQQARACGPFTQNHCCRESMAR
jgi:hypothetical protein